MASNDRCEKCRHWQKITDNSGQCGNGRIFTEVNVPFDADDNLARQKHYPVVTRYDDSCRWWDALAEPTSADSQGEM